MRGKGKNRDVCHYKELREEEGMAEQSLAPELEGRAGKLVAELRVWLPPALLRPLQADRYV